MSYTEGTVGGRIEAVRKSVPPPPHRQARNGYISKEDFAVLLGVSRSRVFAWTRVQHPEYPDEDAQAKLAELSRGRYEAADFARPRQPETEGLDLRVDSLERAVERLEQQVDQLAGSLSRREQ